MEFLQTSHGYSLLVSIDMEEEVYIEEKIVFIDELVGSPYGRGRDREREKE